MKSDAPVSDVLEMLALPDGQRLEWRRKAVPPTPSGLVPLADEGVPFLVVDVGGRETAVELTHEQAKTLEAEARAWHAKKHAEIAPAVAEARAKFYAALGIPMPPLPPKEALR